MPKKPLMSSKEGIFLKSNVTRMLCSINNNFAESLALKIDTILKFETTFQKTESLIPNILSDLEPEIMHPLLTYLIKDSAFKPILRDYVDSADKLRFCMQGLNDNRQKKHFLNYLNTDAHGHDLFHIRKLLVRKDGFKAYYSHKHKADFAEQFLLDEYLDHEKIDLDNGEAIALAIGQLPGNQQLDFIKNLIAEHGPRFLPDKIHDGFQLNAILDSIHFPGCKRKFLAELNYQAGDDWINKLYVKSPLAAEQLKDRELLQDYLQAIKSGLVQQCKHEKARRPIRHFVPKPQPKMQALNTNARFKQP